MDFCALDQFMRGIKYKKHYYFVAIIYKLIYEQSDVVKQYLLHQNPSVFSVFNPKFDIRRFDDSFLFDCDLKRQMASFLLHFL